MEQYSSPTRDERAATTRLSNPAAPGLRGAGWHDAGPRRDRRRQVKGVEGR